VVLCITADGLKLPPMVILKRKTVLKGCNSKDVIDSANEKGWMNLEVKVLVGECLAKEKNGFQLEIPVNVGFV
jgi:hypothetical protein